MTSDYDYIWHEIILQGNKLAKLRRCVSRVHLTERHFKSELSEIKVEEAKRKCETHLLQDERLCAHNNPSTLVLGQLSTLTTQIQTQTQIQTNEKRIHTKYKYKQQLILGQPFTWFHRNRPPQLFGISSAARSHVSHFSFYYLFCHSQPGQVYTPLKMDLLSTFLNKKCYNNPNKIVLTTQIKLL